MPKNKIKSWEIFGVFFLIIFGSFLHFAYDLSDNNPIIGLFSAVNESVWEHLKLGFWALIIFMLIEFWFIKSYAHNYLLAKALGIISMQVFIVIFFYGYTYILKTDILVLDILSYIIGCIICQTISFKIIKRNKMGAKYKIIGLLLLLLQALILMLFTYKTPRLPIFQDYNSLEYGTIWQNK